MYPVKYDMVVETPTGEVHMTHMLGCCSDLQDDTNTFRLSVRDDGHEVIWPLRASSDTEEREWKMAFLSLKMENENKAAEARVSIEATASAASAEAIGGAAADLAPQTF